MRNETIKQLSKSHNVEELKRMFTMRAARLGKLVELSAPLFIVGRELTMVREAYEALCLKSGYDPKTDPRQDFNEEPTDPNPSDN